LQKLGFPEMLDVPALAFSEVMGDVDLFVGAASVGNDPERRGDLNYFYRL
jgi:hypothetical protein